jgi:N-acetylglucosamine-6-phosphate deacetylase
MWSLSIRLAILMPLVGLLASIVGAQPQSTTPPEGIREAPPQHHAFVHARIVIQPGTVIDNGTLIIRDGIIVSAGRETEVPPDARVWDVSGKTIYPGLIDAFTELPADASRADPALSELLGAKYWNSQITPQVRASRIHKNDADASKELNKKLRGQGIVARLVAPSRGLLKGSGAVFNTSDLPTDRSLLKDQVSQHVAMTVARMFDETRGYPTSPMGAFTLVRQAIYDALWYAQAWSARASDPSLPKPEMNDALDVLHTTIASNGLLIFDAPDDLFALRAEQIAREFGLNIAIRGSGQEYKQLDAIAKSGRPILLPVNFPRPPNVASPEAAINVSLEDLMEWDLAPENPAMLSAAGVKFALCSHGLRDKATFLAQVRKAVARGLSADAALAALTTYPASILSIDRMLGTLEPGKLASFVICDGDLFGEKTKVLETWIEGVRHELVPTPVAEPRGTWDFEVSGPTTQPIRFAVEISGDVERLRGRLPARPGRATTGPSTRPTEPEQENADSPPPAPDVPETAPTTSPATRPQSATRPGRGESPVSNVAIRQSQLTFTIKTDTLGPAGITQVSVELVGDDARGRAILPDGTELSASAKRSKPWTPTTTPSDSEEENEETRARGPTSKPTFADPLFPPNYPLGEYGRDGIPAQPDAVLFTNATVWTCGEAGIVQGCDVLVEKGKIKAVAPSIERGSLPAGTQVIDCTGRHITPGIIDCHSHMATDSGINEAGQAVSAEVRIGDFIDPTDITIYRQLAGGVTAANILHGSANPIGGQNQVIKLRWGAGPEAMKFEGAKPGIKFALGENVKQSNWDIPADRRTRYPQSRMGVDEIIRDTFLAAARYARQWDEFRKSNGKGAPPRTDLELQTIAEILAGQRIIHCHSYRQDEILALMRTAEEIGFKVDVFQHILEGYKVADVMRRHGASGSAFSDWWAYKFEVYDAIPYAGALMHDAGVVVSFNSDDGELARRLNLEAAKAVKYGNVSPEEALKFVTLNPAKQLRVDDRVGSIEAGKDADLVVWSRSPLDTFTRAEQTWIDGRRYFDREEDAKMRIEVQNRRAALIQRILASGESPAEPDETPRRAREMWPDRDTFCNHGGRR